MNKEKQMVHTSPVVGEHFEILVKGQLDSTWSTWLEDLDVKLLENGEMLLSGTMADQAALIGVLNKLYSLNLSLLSVSRINSDQEGKKKMENTRNSNPNFETIAWGLVLTWWGITEMIPSLPDGVGTLGIGLILVGLNVARLLKGVPTSGFTTTLGIILLVLGGMELARLVLQLPFELPVFAIVLIVLGVIILGRGFLRLGNEG
jgi:hypothetical protein